MTATTPLEAYTQKLASGALESDPMQARAAEALDELSRALEAYRPRRSWFGLGRMKAPRGIYLHGDVGRGKSMLMDMFFAHAPVDKKRRVHFNAFMVETHARIHEWRKRENSDPIAPVARTIAGEASLLCFDEFQVTDVADAMILGRLFERLFSEGVVIAATSNIEPSHLYEGGLNRQLFLPFIALIKQRLQIVELNGPRDFRLERLEGVKAWLTPLGPETDAAMQEAWAHVTEGEPGVPLQLTVQGRKLPVPLAAKGAARFSFEQLCARPLGLADYLTLARAFHTVLIEHIPEMTEAMRNEARRFTLMIDTFYDERVKVVCSAEVAPQALYVAGDNAEAFRRTVSRLMEMQSAEYLRLAHR